MRPQAGRGTALAAAMVLGASLSGCTAAEDLLGGDETGGTGTPEVGQCYDTPDSVLPDAHDPTPPVDCERPHTLETYAVLHADGPLDQQALARMDQRCISRIDAFLGGADFLHTTVSVYYFAPSRAEQEQGARWVRCDAGVVEDTAVSHTRRVTGSLQEAFADGVPETFRRCLNAPPDPTRAQPLVSCLQPHVAELVPEGLDVGAAAEPYPGAQRLAARAEARCSRIVPGAVPDAARTLVIVPTPQLWKAGRTTAQCWGLAAPGERLNESEAQPA